MFDIIIMIVKRNDDGSVLVNDSIITFSYDNRVIEDAVTHHLVIVFYHFEFSFHGLVV